MVHAVVLPRGHIQRQAHRQHIRVQPIGALRDAQRGLLLRVHVIPDLQRGTVRLGKAHHAVGDAAVFGVVVGEDELGLAVVLRIEGLLPPVGFRTLRLIDQNGIGIGGEEADHTDLVALYIELPGEAGLLHLPAGVGGVIFQFIGQGEQGVVQLLLQIVAVENVGAEGSGEDTYLNAVMGAAMVRGYQGDCSDSTSLAACAKHFVGYGAVEGGRDYNSTYIPPRQMMNVYLPPFEAAVKAGAMTLMTSFNDNDGIPSTGNKELLKGVLRDQWGFDGLVVTDWASAAEMIQHGFAADGKHAAELSLNAGVDMDMMSYVYTAHLEELLSEGKVRMEDIDNAVRNILRVKFRLGLFEHPYVDVAAAQNVQYNDSIMEAAYQTALESAVLLENDGVLPLDMTKVRRVLVTGPMADAPYDQMGTWTFDGQKEHTVTPLDAIREKYGKDVEIIYEPGLTYCREFNSKGIAKAVAAARRADVIFAFMGEEAIMSGEAHCLADITLKGDQRKMLEALASTGKPLVLSVMAGRPLVLDKEASMCDAILYSFHPGTMGGPAIVDLLTGEAVPSGKTPVSFPAASGQVPCYYSHNNTGRPFRGTETMLYDIPLNAGQTSLGNTSYLLDAGFYPQYPFGYGLSYTEFRYSEPVFSTSGAAAAQGSAADSLQHVYSVSDTIHVEAMLSNTGKMQGTEVAQLYVRDLVGSVTRPVKELKAFRRVTLAPGESVKVAFDLPVSDLAFYGLDMKKKVEPGDFQLWIAGDSASGTPAEFTVR